MSRSSPDDSGFIVPSVTLSERLTRIERQQGDTDTRVREIHAAIVGTLERPGLRDRVDRHSRDIGAIQATGQRYRGWAATAILGWLVAAGAAVLAWVRERSP